MVCLLDENLSLIAIETRKRDAERHVEAEAAL